MSVTEKNATKPITLSELRSSDDPTITIGQAASAMKCDPRTISVGIKEGNIPAIRIGRRLVIPREKFLALFEVMTVES